MSSKTSEKRKPTLDLKSIASSDLDSAAVAYRSSQKPKCVTCQDPSVRAIIHEYVSRVDAGTLSLPVPGLLDVLRGEKYRYPHSLNALYRHIRQCERGRG